jgi:hypothetical protein
MTPVRKGNPEAANAIWQRDVVVIEPESVSRLRRRGLLRSLFPAAVGATFYYFDSHGAAMLLFATAAILVAASIASPRGLLPAIERGVTSLAEMFARALTWLIMTLVFFLFFVPFGLLMRRGERDHLRRKFDPDAATYWEPCEGTTVASKSLERQY